MASRRRAQSAGDLATVPSGNWSGDRYDPNFPANSFGGWANGESFFHRASREAGGSAATAASATSGRVASEKRRSIEGLAFYSARCERRKHRRRISTVLTILRVAIVEASPAFTRSIKCHRYLRPVY